jgi:hypothetical protein
MEATEQATLEAVRREAYAHGLMGVKPPRQTWLSSDAFSRAYAEGWMEGALAATAPTIPTSSPSPQTIIARFL